MFYSKILNYDCVNGVGWRVSLFVSGCNFHCHNCFNQELQDFDYGKPYTKETEELILNLLDNPNIKGLSILGGDPLCQTLEDMEKLLQLVHKTHALGKDVWIWSGYTWESLDIPFYTAVKEMRGGRCPIEELLSTAKAVAKTKREYMAAWLVRNCDVFVDGTFVEYQKDLSLPWRGSANQRVIDVRQSLGKNKLVLFKDESVNDDNK